MSGADTLVEDTMTSDDRKGGSVRKPRSPRLVLSILIVVASCLIALLIAEVTVRVVGLGSDQLLRPDPVLGVRFIESKSGLSQGPCYRADVTINPDGWRSPAVSVEKPADVFRVLVLGDSFMAGLQVADDETFTRVLERRLNQAGLGRRVEVINFGVPSWGTDQEYLALREYGVRLKPDLVVLAFYAQNDVAETDPEIRSTTSTYPKPYFTLRDGQLVEEPFSDPTPALIGMARRLAAPLRIYPLTRDGLLTMPAVHRLLYSLGIVGVVPQTSQSTQPQGATVWQWPDRWRRQIGVFERRTDWSNAWTITEGLVRLTHSEATRAGASFLIVGVASPIEVMPASLLGGLAGGGADDLDIDKPSTRLTQIAERQGLDLVSLVPDFRDRIAGSTETFEGLFLRCDGHWTAAGHRLAADIVAPSLAARIAGARMPAP